MALQDPFKIVIQAVDRASPIIDTISSDLGKLAAQLTSFSGLYDLLIGQNNRLQQALLSTEATLVGTNKIIQNGLEIKDPTAAIKALQAPVEEAVQRVRQGSLELVGVTSAELIPLLQIVTGQASQIGANLNESADLTLDFAASLGTLGIPLSQARQEIVSILTSTIDINSSLGKSLNLTNAQVNQYKAQGVLVEKLRERLEAFRSGNALAAQTIDGITSNIAELVQVATQKGGADLIKPLVDGLNSFYEFLKANQGQIEGFFAAVSQAIQNIIPPLVEAGKAFNSQFGDELTKILGASLDLVIQAFQGLGYAVAGAIQAFVEFDKQVPIVSDTLKNIGEKLALAAEGWRKLKAAVDFYSGAQADSDEATAIYEKQANDELDRALKIIEKTTPKLKDLQDKQKDGKELTKAEKDELAKLQAQRTSAANGLRSLSTSLKDANVVGEANQATLKGLTNQLDLFAGKLTQTDLAARDLTNLGNTYQQLADRVQAAQNQIANHPDDAAFKTATKDIIDLTKQQVELGAITTEQATARLAAIRDDGRVQVETQRAAQKAIADILKNDTDERVKQLDDRIKKTQAAVAAETLGEASGSSEVTRLKGEQIRIQLENVRKALKEEQELKRSQLQAELKDLETQYNAVAGQNSPQGTVLEGQIANAQTKAQQNTALLKDLENQYNSAMRSGNNFQAGVLESQIAKTRGAANANSDTLRQFQSQYDALAKTGDKKQSDSLAKQIANTKAALSLSSNRVDELTSQASQLESQITTNQAEAEKQRRAERLKDFDERQTEVQSEYEQRLISEAEFNRRSLLITKGKIQEELKQLGERRKTLLSTPQGRADKQGLEALNAEEDKLRGERAKALEEFQDKQNQLQLRKIEEAQKKASDAITQSETERLTQIQRIENQHTITHAEAEKLRVDETGDRIKQELKLEQDKLAELQKLPSLSDPIKEEERQERIRTSRIKTADLTKQLAENELRQQEATSKVIQEKIDLRLQLFKNAITQENLALEGQQNLLDTLNRSLSQQNRLLEVRKNLQNSLTDYYTGELSILEKTATTEGEKRELAETTAFIRLNSLREQQKLEREVLDLNLRQRDAALAIEKSKNESARLQNLADIAEARANIEKTRNQQGLTREQKDAQLQADYLNYRAKIAAGAALAANAASLDQQGRINQIDAQSQRTIQRRSQLLAFGNAEVDAANSIVDPERRARALQAVGDEARSVAFGNADPSEVRRNIRSYNQQGEASFTDRLGNPIAPPPSIPSDLRFNTNVPQLELPSAPDLETIRRQFEQNLPNPLKLRNGVALPDLPLSSQQNLRQQLFGNLPLLPGVASAANSVVPNSQSEKPLQFTGDVNMANTIQIHLNSPADKRLEVEMEGHILDSLDGVFRSVKQRLGG